MRPLVNEQKQKFLSTLIVSVGALLGFKAVSYAIGIYQLRTSLLLAFYIYLFHLFWLTFLFDLHLKKRGVLANAKLNAKGLRMFWMAFKDRCSHIITWKYIRHYQNYLVLPGLIYWATVILLLLNPFKNGLKFVIAGLATIAMAVVYWYMKEHISRQLEVQDHWIRVLSIVKLFAAFLVYSAVIGVTVYFNFDTGFLLLATLTLTFLLIYQALFQHGLVSLQIVLWTLLVAVIQALLALWIYSNWNTEYFTAGLVMAASYNTLWGILHHYLDRTLTRRVAFEYLIMTVLIISFLFASHNFNQRVI